MQYQSPEFNALMLETQRKLALRDLRRSDRKLWNKVTKKPKATVVRDGVVYYQNRRGYFQSPTDGVLHRVIYSAEYGNIPHGWHVHHRDGNPANNELDNLQAMGWLDHSRVHRSQPHG